MAFKKRIHNALNVNGNILLTASKNRNMDVKPHSRTVMAGTMASKYQGSKVSENSPTQKSIISKLEMLPGTASEIIHIGLKLNKNFKHS